MMRSSTTNDHLRAALTLYVVTDERRDHDELLDILRQALQGGVTAIQLRRKNEDGAALVDLGRRIRLLTQEFGAAYFVNDRVDIALLTDADGVHVGQSDIACPDVRTLLGPHRWIGVSACSVQEAVQAQHHGADYLGVGSMMFTSTKPDADLCSIDGLRKIVNTISIPVVTIGGMTSVTAPQMMAAGACGVAVVSSVMQAANPQLAASEMMNALKR